MNPDEIRLTLLSLSYERYVSRAHTIFESYWNIFFGILVGTLGLVIALIEIEVLEFNRPIFILIIIVLALVNTIVGIIAYYTWNESKLQRNMITEKIKALATTQSNQSQPPISFDF